MSNIAEENNKQEQIEHYKELLENKREQYEALKDVLGSPEAESQRNQLFEQIKQIEITIAELMEKGEEIDKGQSKDTMDMFDD